MTYRTALGRLSFALLTVVFVLMASGDAKAVGELTVAVASNALRPVGEIVASFEEDEGIQVSLVHGSTGRLYTQIIAGAPFDIFLAADALRPALLVERGFASGSASFTYARGRLVLWTSRAGLSLEDRGVEALSDPSIDKIAIANPKTAPYGRAAMEVIDALHGGSAIEKKLVYGASVSLAFSYARTGNVDITITSLSTIYNQGAHYFVIADTRYSPIIQDGVILKDAPESAFRFVKYLKGARARKIFEKYGYEIDPSVASD